MYLCKRDVSQECKGDYKDCTDCILDKISTEIKEETDRDNHADDYCDGYYDGMRKALAIIDKYKAESEEE